jgi:glycosyltransferase involved in cell wall biosynthesis
MVFHFPPISGGGVVIIIEIANTLASLGHDVTVLTPDLKWNGETYKPKIYPDIKVIRVSTPSSSNLKVAARRCKTNLKNKGIEIGKDGKFDFILSIFHPFHLVPRAAVECGKKIGIPTIIKIDDAIYEKATGLKSIQRKIEKMYNSKTLQNASKILVSNEGTKLLVSEYYNVSTKKISIIPNGVDLSTFYSKEPRKQIIFSGVMYYHRGIDILLQSVKQIIKIIPDVKFIFLGSGPELSKLKEISIKNNIVQNVIFEGWVDREKIPHYLAESAIGIGPLRATDVTKNALPIKVLEYMASSLPIIAWEDTLPDDVLRNGHNGYFVSNIQELSEKIIFLLKNEEIRKKMGINSKEMVNKFDWKNIVELILDEFQKINSVSQLK